LFTDSQIVRIGARPVHDVMRSQLLVAVIVLAILGLVVYVTERADPYAGFLPSVLHSYRDAIRALVGLSFLGFLLWLVHVFGGWRL
jgi:hypothetical protein